MQEAITIIIIGIVGILIVYGIDNTLSAHRYMYEIYSCNYSGEVMFLDTYEILNLPLGVQQEFECSKIIAHQCKCYDIKLSVAMDGDGKLHKSYFRYEDCNWIISNE